jgi:putative ABC transport system permease protein
MKAWKKIRHLMRRRQFEQDLSEEMQFHREMAGPAFGSVALALEDSRQVWTFGWLESLALDIRHAIRGFRKTPGFALTVIGTIGLALGLNTTLFTAFNAYVLRPLAVQDPYSLYGFTWTNQRGAGHAFAVRDYEEFRESGVAFSDVLAYETIFAALNGHTMVGQAVSANYFAVLGAGTFLGRPLMPGDSDTIILSHAVWKDRFGADPEILGSKLYLRGVPLEVVGVASPGFGGVSDYPAGFWAPLAVYSQVESQPANNLKLVGRLRRNLTPATARAALEVWARQATAQLSETQRAAGVVVESHATMIPFTLDALRVTVPLFAAFALVLLIACANVTSMMLARALARQREIGIRISLGAGRARLIRQLLTESLLLAIPAAAVGFAISIATMRAATRIMFATLPEVFAKVVRIVDLSPDARVFVFILLAALASTLLFGLAPAIQTTRTRLVQANRGDFSSDYRPTRLRNALVVTQVTVCALLLICAGVVLRGELRMSTQDFGVQTSGVFCARVAAKFQAGAAAVLAAQKDVEAVAAVWHAPLYGPLRRIAVFPSGARDTLLEGYNFVSSDYFRIFRIPLLRGREFSAEESRVEAPVIVLSESAARRLWPGHDPVGQTVEIRTEAGKDPYFSRLPAYRVARVIGVARDVMNGWTDTGRDVECLYFPTNAAAANNEALLVRANSRRSIEEALDRIAPSTADYVSRMDEALATQSYPFRMIFWIAAALSGLALALTVSGIYGVLSYLVSQRTREIGIRVALGAGARSVVGMVMRQSLRLAAIGTALGVLCALAAAPIFAHTVSALKPYDLVAYVGGAILVLAAAVGAAFSPSRRAAQVDPAITLRGD